MATSGDGGSSVPMPKVPRLFDADGEIDPKAVEAYREERIKRTWEATPVHDEAAWVYTQQAATLQVQLAIYQGKQALGILKPEEGRSLAGLATRINQTLDYLQIGVPVTAQSAMRRRNAKARAPKAGAAKLREAMASKAKTRAKKKTKKRKATKQ